MSCPLVLDITVPTSVLVPGYFTVIGNCQWGSIAGTITAQADLMALFTPITAHIAARNNPHVVTKTQVGLGNVDNTSDLLKPVSTATATALSGKADLGEDGKVLPNQLPAFSSTLAALTDVTITVPAADEVLKYNGTKWVNAPAAGGDTPFAEKTYSHATYGSVAYLDATNTLQFTGYNASGVNKLELWVISADSGVTGNAVLVVNGESFIVPVTATLTKITLTLATLYTGIIIVSRNTASASDTLGVVTALVVDWKAF